MREARAGGATGEDVTPRTTKRELFYIAVRSGRAANRRARGHVLHAPAAQITSPPGIQCPARYH